MADLNVVPGINPQVGDTIHIVASFLSNVNGSATLHLNFPGSIAPPNQGVGETDRDSIITVDSGSTYSYSLPFKIFGYGGSIVTASIQPATRIPGWYNESSSTAEIENTSSSFSVMNQGIAANDTGTVTYGTDGGGNTLTFQVSGTVTYEDAWEQNAVKGAYGVRVIVLFHDPGVTGSSTPCPGYMNLNFSHPITGCIVGTHYCKCDVDGNFSFNFNFSTSSLTWKDKYTDFVLLVTTWNDACSLVNGGNPFSSVPLCSNFSTFCNFQSKYTINNLCSALYPATTFRRGISYCQGCPNSNMISETGIKIHVSPPNGGTLRYMELCQEFENARLGITTDQDQTIICPRSGTCFGGGNTNCNNTEITGNDISTQVVAHEYGHLLACTLNPGAFFGADGCYGDPCVEEDFAEMHQFAVRNWMNNVYDEYIDWTLDNREENPFWSSRIAGGASFLWNIYDSYSDPPYRSPRYAGDDNDDIGEPLLVFNTWKGLTGDEPNERQFANDLEAAVSTDEANSIEDIYQFTLGTPPNYNGNASNPMRPAQVKGLYGSIVHCDGFNCEVYHVSLNWTPQVYGSVVYENAPSGIHIYENGGTTPIQTLSGTATSTSLDITGANATFTVSTYRQYSSPHPTPLAADAYGAPSIYLSADGGEKIADGHAPDTSSLQVSVHPNPASGTVKVCVEDLPAGIPVVVSVVSQTATSVATLYNATPDAELGLCLQLDCSKLANGNYYADLQTLGMHHAVKFTVEH